MSILVTTLIANRIYFEYSVVSLEEHTSNDHMKISSFGCQATNTASQLREVEH